MGDITISNQDRLIRLDEVLKLIPIAKINLVVGRPLGEIPAAGEAGQPHHLLAAQRHKKTFGTRRLNQVLTATSTKGEIKQIIGESFL